MVATCCGGLRGGSEVGATGNSTAMHNLGICYEKGSGITIDLEKAVHWYQKSAKTGNSIAMNVLGSCYEEGNEVAIDLEKAVHWCPRSVIQTR